MSIERITEKAKLVLILGFSTFELQAIMILRDTTRVKGPANPLTFAGPLTFGAGPLTRCVTLNHYCLQFKSGFLAFWRLHKQYPANPLMK